MNNQAFSKIGIIVILVILIVGGILAWQYFGAPEEEVEDETANWKTYKNEEYGFEMKYPPFLEKGDELGCRIEELEDIIFIDPVGVKVYNAEGLTLEEWLNKEAKQTEEKSKEIQEYFKSKGYKNWKDFGTKLLSKEELFVGGEEAIKLSFEFIGAGYDLPVGIYTKKGNRIYVFQTNDGNLNDQDCAFKAFGKKPSEAMELILSTFRFLE